MALLQGAGNDGTLSVATMQSLQVLDLNAQLQTGMGISAGDVNASEVLLYTILVDDSTSIDVVIDGVNNSDNVMLGHNELRGAILDSKQQ